MAVRGIRGAVQVASNRKELIHRGTQRMLRAIVRRNRVGLDDIAGVFLTATSDLDADFPAYGARAMGWTTVPLLCARELEIPGGMPRVIRVLVLANSDRPQREIEHVYLGAAARLRPDWKKRKTRGSPHRKG